ncbi:MAG: PadR family transcriptional regulator [Reichenbachiella sp.]
MKGTYLGEFEEIVLLIVATMNGEAYGVSVKTKVQDQLKRSTTLSAVHTALHRLESKGFVISEMGESTNVRGGKKKRLFKITSEGSHALEHSRSVREQLWEEMHALTKSV